MTTRPAGKFTWATDLLYPSTAVPTKVEPADAVKARGHLRNARWPAQYQNWRENAIGQALAVLDPIHVLNWSGIEVVGSGALVGLGPVSIVTTPRGRTLLAVEKEIHECSAARGGDWSQVVAASLTGLTHRPNFQCGASFGNFAIFAGKTTTYIVVRTESTGLWSEANTNATIAGAEYEVACVFKDDFYFGGGKPLGLGIFGPCVLGVDGTVLSQGAVFDLNALPSGGWVGGDARITLMAASPDLIVAVASNSTASPYILTSSNGTAWSSTRPVLPDMQFHTLLWDESTGSFEMIALDGSIYSSLDGAAWTRRVDVPAPTPNAIKNARRLTANAGAMWLSVNTQIETRDLLIYSVDRGATWTNLGDITRGAAFNAYRQTPEVIWGVYYSGGRFWCIQPGVETGADPFAVQSSLRITP